MTTYTTKDLIEKSIAPVEIARALKTKGRTVEDLTRAKAGRAITALNEIAGQIGKPYVKYCEFTEVATLQWRAYTDFGVFDIRFNKDGRVTDAEQSRYTADELALVREAKTAQHPWEVRAARYAERLFKYMADAPGAPDVCETRINENERYVRGQTCGYVISRIRGLYRAYGPDDLHCLNRDLREEPEAVLKELRAEGVVAPDFELYAPQVRRKPKAQIAAAFFALGD